VILVGDVRRTLGTVADGSVQCVVTSPPYWGLRDYGHDGQIGLERAPDEYVAEMVAVFREVRRVLAGDGVLWLNLGDSYAGSGKGGNPEGSKWSGFVGNKDRETSAKASKPIVPDGLKPKDLVGIPWRVAFALQADGWWLRQDIIWHKPNPMPESVTDRCTKAHEYMFMLTKSARYYFDNEAIAEPSVSYDPKQSVKHGTGNKNIIGGMSERGVTRTTEGLNLKSQAEKTHEMRNRRSVWTVPTKPFRGAHFATFPPQLIEPCILATSRPGDMVLDPFFGAGTTGLVAQRHGRRWIGCELNPAYAKLAEERINEEANLFAVPTV